MSPEETLFNTVEKKIDESKQGTVYQPESTSLENGAGKRFYIESYGVRITFRCEFVISSRLDVSREHRAQIDHRTQKMGQLPESSARRCGLVLA